MKRYKLLLLSCLSLFLVACNLGNKPAEETTTTTVASETTTTETTTTTIAADAPAGENDIVFEYYVHGEKIEEHIVRDAVGKSVFDAMNSLDDITSTFDDEQGIFVNFFDHTNDAENSWVYLLNDQVAELGTKSQTLSKGDTIKWYFGTIDEIPVTIIPETTIAEESSEDTTESSTSAE